MTRRLRAAAFGDFGVEQPGEIVTLGWRVWGGGEAMAMRAVRDSLGARGVPRRSMQALGYWKHDSTPEEMW